MKNTLVLKISLYLIAIIAANFVVLWFGQKGLLFTAMILIPFDFVMRCLFHEKWKGRELILKLGVLVIVASVITFLINKDARDIAVASSAGFISAQIVAGIFYQFTINKSYFVKVNGSDLVGIITDSIIFQAIAFSYISPEITAGQVGLKFIGGLFWYWVLFKKMKLQNTL